MRELTIRYLDELTGAYVHLKVKISVERDGVVAQGLKPTELAIAKQRALAAATRSLNDLAYSNQKEEG